MRLLLATAVLVCAACGTKEKFEPIDMASRQVTLPNGNVITAVPAMTELEKLQGLRYYDSLPPDRGMLFIYAKQEKRQFWMYGAKFSVDIIWIDKDHRIVEMSVNTPVCPSTSARQCPNYGGKQESRFVLMVGAGVASKNGLRLGERLEF
jgi:uncharacterized membrane protein (UPF0127 family)